MQGQGEQPDRLRRSVLLRLEVSEIESRKGDRWLRRRALEVPCSTSSVTQDKEQDDDGDDNECRGCNSCTSAHTEASSRGRSRCTDGWSDDCRAKGLVMVSSVTGGLTVSMNRGRAGTRRSRRRGNRGSGRFGCRKRIIGLRLRSCSRWRELHGGGCGIVSRGCVGAKRGRSGGPL